MKPEQLDFDWQNGVQFPPDQFHVSNPLVITT